MGCIDFVVGKVFGPAAVGIYTVAFRIVADPVKTLASVVNQVAYPAFAKLQDEPERDRGPRAVGLLPQVWRQQ